MMGVAGGGEKLDFWNARETGKLAFWKTEVA